MSLFDQLRLFVMMLYGVLTIAAVLILALLWAAWNRWRRSEMYQPFNVTVYVGGIPFECKGTYTPYTDGSAEFEIDTTLLDGAFEIWHGLRPEWQEDIEEQVGQMIRERRV